MNSVQQEQAKEWCGGRRNKFVENGSYCVGKNILIPIRTFELKFY